MASAINIAGFLFALFLRVGLDIAHEHRRVVIGVLLNAADKHLPRFVLRHCADALHLGLLLVHKLLGLVVKRGDFRLLFIERFLAQFQVVKLLIQRLLALYQPPLGALLLVAPVADLSVQFVLILRASSFVSRIFSFCFPQRDAALLPEAILHIFPFCRSAFL